MHVLDDIFETLQLKGALYFRTDFSPPWSVAVPDYEQAARFHLVVQGMCHLTPAGHSPIAMNVGDMVLVPAGRAHIIAGAPETWAPPLEQVLEDAGYSGQGVLSIGRGDAEASTQLVCGHLNFRNAADHPLLRALPTHLHITSGVRAHNAWLDEVLRLIVRQVFAEETPSTAAVTRLSEIVFIEAIKACADQSDSLSQVFAALKDPQIGRALTLIHEQPEQGWTVDSLASGVGMSRSRFAEKFRDLIGSGPMAYLGDWRMQKAIGYLSGTQASIQQIALKTGYQSPAAFTRAFSQKLGQSPRDFRRASA